MDFLVFRLYGPMMSWGEIAVGGERRSARHPSRSAITGLVAAALGIKRDDENRQNDLEGSVGFGLKLLSAGDILKDYHTAQVPKAESKVKYCTRRDELNANPAAVSTILSSREYRTDSMCIVALWSQPEVVFSLSQIKAALEKPVFHLYLGRKSCPIACPMQPQFLEDTTLRLALDSAQFFPLKQYRVESESECLNLLRRQNVESQYFWEPCSHVGMDAKIETIRYDRVVSRKRWQFAPRTESMAFSDSREGD
jgi:CRISPR system Cascade subunit CasD